MTVRAKFSCSAVTTFAGGTQKIEMVPLYSTTGENKDFTNATPSGKFEMVIATGMPAAEYFKPGEFYYLDFTKAPK